MVLVAHLHGINSFNHLLRHAFTKSASNQMRMRLLCIGHKHGKAAWWLILYTADIQGTLGDCQGVQEIRTCSTFCCVPNPALLMRQSSLPCSLMVSVMHLWTDASSVTSSCLTWKPPAAEQPQEHQQWQ